MSIIKEESYNKEYMNGKKKWSKNVNKKWSGVVKWNEPYSGQDKNWELECTFYVHSAMQKKGRKMLHLKEGEAEEHGEGKLTLPPFSNEGGEVSCFLKAILKYSLWLSEICVPYISNT